MSSNDMNLIIDEINSYIQFSDIDIEKIVDYEIGYAFRIAKFAKSHLFKFNQLRGILDSMNRIMRVPSLLLFPSNTISIFAGKVFILSVCNCIS